MILDDRIPAVATSDGRVSPVPGAPRAPKVPQFAVHRPKVY
jgi:hypothetical protein